MTQYYAHSTERDDMADWEPLATHLARVAQRAGLFAEGFGAGKAAYLAGLLHDLGKYSPQFQAYIRGKGPGVDHSTAGARVVRTLTANPQDKLVADIISYAIAGHHAGLPDYSGTRAPLSGRLEEIYPISPLAEIWRDEVQADARDLLPKKLLPKKGRLAFQLSVLGRMIFSCLVDADSLETEAFDNEVHGTRKDRIWPDLQTRLPDLIAAFDAYMAAKYEALPEERRTHPLNLLRQEVLAHVRGKVQMPKGLFTLDVPTGGGKTLASLAFALEHARTHGMARIIYSIPYTSIIEQTAGIFEDVLGANMVLEHHSAIETSTMENEEKDPSSTQTTEAKRRRAMENWDAPVVVSTSVQLFESLFSHRKARCRKLHHLANSVIILDEAQVMPLNLLRPCVAMLDELALNYGCTIVLCTATQPALLAPDFTGGLEPERVHELAPDPERLDAAFRRMTLDMRTDKMSDAALVAELADWAQGLIIVNTRKHALKLYEAAKEARLEGLVHLSARQTGADRAILLADVRERLACGAPCRVISTSLIEAGVDVSFPRVWRAKAGLESIIQSAGRCNRESRWNKEDSRIVVFTPEYDKPPPSIRAHVKALDVVSGQHADLFSKAAIKDYFGEIYWQKGDALDRIDIGDDKTGAVLEQFMVGGRPNMRTDFAYRTVGENFHFIETTMVPVIIPQTEEAQQALDGLDKGLPAGEAARKLQRHVVQIPDRDRKKMIENGHVAFKEGFADQFAVLRADQFYSRERGLLWERADELGGDYII